MIEQNADFILGAQGLGDVLALVGGEDNTAVFGVYGDGVVQQRQVLIDHLEVAPKGRPGAAGDGVCMADGVDVWARLVDFRVD